MSKLVSVIIPCYNAEKYIKETIYSALNQTYKNIELIVIDDGSEDRSREIIEEIMQDDRRVKYIYQKNLGVSSARNKGISMSKGYFITFLDSDDILHRSKIERQIKKINETNSDACYCGYYNWYFDKGIKEKKSMKFTSKDFLKEYLSESCIPQTCTWLIKSELIKKNNILFNEECSWGEDIEFLAKVITLSKISFVSEYLVDYRIINTSLSSRHNISYKDIAMWNRLKEWIKENIPTRYKEYIEIIDKYRITRTYIDNCLKEIKLEKDYRIFWEDKKKAMNEIRICCDIKQMKLYFKKIYIMWKVKLK